MTGVEEGRLLAYLDGEMDAAERAEVERRVAETAETRCLLEEIRDRRRRVDALLGELPEHPVDDDVRRRVRTRARIAATGGHGTTKGHGWWARRGRLAQAATILLFLAGGAAAAVTVPGSPLRDLFREMRDGATETAATTSLATPAAEDGPDDEVGLRVGPADGRLTIVLSGLSDATRIRVSLVDGARGGVFGPRGTRFRSGTGRIEASLGAGPLVRVEIPRGLEEASVRVDGTVYLEKRGDRIELPGPSPTVDDGQYTFGER